ncbi:MAG TPA: calcium/sodium antiporter [Acinetobacter sp.]|jgi:cation:H+ antiporter|uniref:calcium/sodium antiporter n=1 Tax=Acinetobacter TaxID=469 RepID=UPI000C4E45CF|nr:MULTISPECIES: calcium/sodium antiporter [Acinetobacter]MEC8569163.1 calcium/sodium antiporter [Pseudomonadota bacterium]MBC69770.1 calcium/sodium antiporter [Acinetobacter sp.]MBT50412.1 calcium/sodium antiporter [Acinetobacter sp.]HBO71073.1 calcium/sodium antiporter [Acinetobacter sp.]HIQ34048.1 calcium/sodium antiporter [Acinetobacter venetianus]
MLWAVIAVILGLVLLVWSADKFIDGASATASHFGMPPLLVGMVIVGFGTSAPEIVVSVMAAIDGNPGLALGNAYGSNIANIALILGVTVLIQPIMVHSAVVRKELPLLLLVTGICIFQIFDGVLSRNDAIIMLLMLVLYMGWTIWQGMRNQSDVLSHEFDHQLQEKEVPLKTSIFQLIFGLIVLVISSRLLVWGAVEIAQAFGVSELIIGLTVVAVGTSLPELASSIAAARKGELDIAIGNVIGSNMFNTLAVVGLAGVIHPTIVPPEVLQRDMVVMGTLTLSLLLFTLSFKGQGRIGRVKGSIWLFSFVAYTCYLINTAF